MFFTLVKMVKAAILMGIIVGLLRFAVSNLANMKLFTKILILVTILDVATSFIIIIGLRNLIILVLLFLAMSTISRIGLFIAIVTKKILEDIDKWRKI